MSQLIRCHWPSTSFIGYLQPAVAMHELAHRGALGAMRAAVDRAVPGGLLADPDAVLHFGDDGAADRAMGADILADGDCGAGAAGAAGLGLAHAAERQRAQRRQTAGGEARAAQEGAAIETSIRLIGEGGSERRVVSRVLSS